MSHNRQKQYLSGGKESLRASHRQPDEVRVRALYDYLAAMNPGDLTFRKDEELLAIVVEGEMYWTARKISDERQTGQIPSDFVQICETEWERLPAWHDGDKNYAERLLLLPGSPSGSYIVRPSSKPGQLAISVRVKVAGEINRFEVNHFLVHRMDNGGFYIFPNRIFDNLNSLIKTYSKIPSKCTLCNCRRSEEEIELGLPFPHKYRPPVKFRDMEVDRKCIRLGRRLGGGQFGDVYVARWNGTLEVAVKTMRFGKEDSSRFIAEAENLHRLRHPKILQLLGVCMSNAANEPLYIITEFMPHGSLLDFLRNLRQQRQQPELKQLVDYAAQVADGMAYLESERVVHRDVRAANVLVSEQEVKIADFGMLRFVHEESDVYSTSNGKMLPVRWTAPEAMTSGNFDTKSDVWSFGVLMWEILTLGSVPYLNIVKAELHDRILNGYRLPMPENCNQSLYDVMLKCWDENPNERWTFEFLKDSLDNWAFYQTENCDTYDNCP